MRDIRRELAAVALCKLLLRDVKGQNDRAAQFRPPDRDAADVELPDAAAALAAQLAVAVGQRPALMAASELVAALDGEKIPARRSCASAPNRRLRRRR
ncbi:MAG: hypothetical protein ACLSHG_13670 [Oscillospiraceae bacterium]